MFKGLLKTINVVVVAVCQQDIGNPDTSGIGKTKHFIDFPGWVDNGRSVACMIMYQVDKVLHGAELHAVNTVAVLVVLHILTPAYRI